MGLNGAIAHLEHAVNDLLELACKYNVIYKFTSLQIQYNIEYTRLLA